MIEQTSLYTVLYMTFLYTPTNLNVPKKTPCISTETQSHHKKINPVVYIYIYIYVFIITTFKCTHTHCKNYLEGVHSRPSSQLSTMWTGVKSALALLPCSDALCSLSMVKLICSCTFSACYDHHKHYIGPLGHFFAKLLKTFKNKCWPVLFYWYNFVDCLWVITATLLEVIQISNTIWTI